MPAKIKTKKTYLSKIILTFIFIAAFISSYITAGSPNIYALPNSTYVTLGTLPEAAAQPTVLGKQLHYLAVNNNKIYAGYGDLVTNTGPIAIDPYNIGSGQFDGNQLTDQTEEIDIFRTIAGKLYAPDGDPRGTNTPSGFSFGPPWTEMQPEIALHVRDVAGTSASDLWFTGDQSSDADIWHSTDSGATWQLSLTSGGPPFSWMIALNGKIITQSIAASTSKIWNGTSWQNGPDIDGWSTWDWDAHPTINSFPSYPEVFKGKLISSDTGLSSFDGTTLTQIPGFGPGDLSCGTTPCTSVVSMQSDSEGNYFYILKNDHTIVRSSDLSTWTTVATNVPSTVMSMAVTGNYIYLGTSDSKIMRSQDQVASLVPGDANSDNHVNLPDLTILLANWHTTNTSCDFNSDGTVDTADLSILLSNYGT